MQSILVYDTANEQWYTQESSGDVPSWRMSGCSVIVAAPDNSSYCIYVYGGMETLASNSDGDVYVLSLPSFQWIRVAEGDNVHIKHKCQIAGKRTMLVVGGTKPTDDSESDPSVANCDSGAFANGLGIFNLSSHTWLTDYDATDGGEYPLSSAITDIIGGT
ncbi:hypothetical protein BO78DRAFT_230974 [Aspergillus sclerotiicarbonarius CBS 121057]|uniref:Galactose oxidase n=1 Tax=Aspergillus sclerotiicarbonarius (strain CBS 121057 / IBT 28362) TaxID=1448318 RepID=A0A319F8J4_ASPSB|nr:hypothetical protein BO78DRAFT_230974 [Aspergillus sclerotiicarbonarius CBS 121057]